MKQVNIFRVESTQWCYALWVDGEFDHSDTIDDADSEAEAREAVEKLWPDSKVSLVESVP